MTSLLFDPVQLMTFLNDWENASFQLFSPLCVFPKHSSGRRVTLNFKADIGLKKVVSRAEPFFVTKGLFRKSSKTGFLFHCWGKNGFRLSGIFLG